MSVRETLTSSTINGSFDPRSNSLNALRLLMATAVLVAHSWPLTGRDIHALVGLRNIGAWSVYGFFVISGYLITRSRLNGRPASDFYRARVLRIMPAFIVALLVIAFVLAPTTQLVHPAEAWDLRSALTFVGRNFFLYPPDPFAQVGIEATLTNNPYPMMWNGSLWTLWWEAWCYIIVGVAASLLPRRVLPFVAVVAFVAATTISMVGALGGPVSDLVQMIVPMFIAFFAGMCLLLLGNRIRVNVAMLVLAVFVLVVAVRLNMWQQLGLLPMAYLVLVLGNVLPFTKLGSRFDLSYGVYIYAWPMQQMVALMGGDRLPIGVYIALVLAITLSFAFLSSLLVERPAMRLKKSSSRAPTDSNAE